MSAGILRNWYLSKIGKTSTPHEYFLAWQEYLLYEVSVFNYNLRKNFS